MTLYQFGIIGRPSPEQHELLVSSIQEMVAPFGLVIGNDIDVLVGDACLGRNPKTAFAAVYFGNSNDDPASAAVLEYLVHDNLPIIPVVELLGRFHDLVPPILLASNGLSLEQAGPKFEFLSSCVLECLGLLHRQRRVFLSYRRTESAHAALQLHEALSSQGYEVFLDTYDVRPAEDFQAILWHKLCDSDVVVMLDTPDYFGSRWTAAEIGRALAKKIAVLGVVWPNHTPQRVTQLREPIFLADGELLGPTGPLAADAVKKICLSVESLRSRSIAIRYAAIAGQLTSAASELGGTIEAIGIHRSMRLKLADGRTLDLFPAVGVPTAELFNSAADHRERLSRQANTTRPVLVYDNVGLHKDWQKHLDWLDKNLKVVRGLQVNLAAWQLADWED